MRLKLLRLEGSANKQRYEQRPLALHSSVRTQYRLMFHIVLQQNCEFYGCDTYVSHTKQSILNTKTPQHNYHPQVPTLINILALLNELIILLPLFIAGSRLLLFRAV